MNPDEENKEINKDKEIVESLTTEEQEKLNRIDTTGNGKVTIAEAKAAGYGMPIYSTDWLYQYMSDPNEDGIVGE